MIEVKNLTCAYEDRVVLKDLTAQFPMGQVTMIIGPNGSGKSTLLKTILGLQKPLSGEVLVDGVNTRALKPRALAQKAAYLLQSRNVPSIQARKMVLHGRFPYLSYPRRYRAVDQEIVNRAMAQTDCLSLAEEMVNELSGGQRQKVYLAMALAQDTQTVFMDEPTTFLDIRHQLDLMKTARSLADQGKAVVMVLHDLCLAMEYADRILVVSDSTVQLADTPEAAFESGILDEIFHISLRRFRAGEKWKYYYET